MRRWCSPAAVTSGTRSFASDPANGVAGADDAGRDDARVHPAQAELPVRLRIDEPRRIRAEASRELRAASVGNVRDLEYRGTDLDARARRQVFDADVEVDVQLVARERPALATSGDEVDDARVHQRDLRMATVVL